MAHMPCLPSDPTLRCWHRKSDAAAGCWHRKYSEDEDELLPLYVRRMKPKTEGSLRRRLLTAKIHQKQDALWTPKPLGGPPAPRPAQATPPRPCCTPQPGQDPSAVSSLDQESRWTVHYAAPWRQQEDLLLPGTRPTCVEDLHRQAKANQRPSIPEYDKLGWDWLHSPWYWPQDPTLSTSSLQSRRTSQQDHRETKKPTGCSAEDNLEFLPRPQSPPNGEGDDLIQTDWSHALPLPTPEERMRQQALAIAAHIVPIDITGETFDRQASRRRSLVTMDTGVNQPNDRWRQSIPGTPHDIQQEAEDTRKSELPGRLSHACSAKASTGRRPTRDSSCQTEEESTAPPNDRGMRAQRGQDVPAFLSNMSASWSGDISASAERTGEPLFHSLPRLPASVHTALCRHSATHCVEDPSAGPFPGQSSHTQSQQTSALPTPDQHPPDSPPCYPTCRAPSAQLTGRSPGIARSESSQSDKSSGATANGWEGEALPSSPLSSLADSGSAPVGVRSQSSGSLVGGGAGRGVYQCRQHQSERSGLSGAHTLRRSISLRKAKRPPAPPTRSDSLCRAPPTRSDSLCRAPPTRSDSLCRAPPTATPITSTQHSHTSCPELGVFSKCSSPSNSCCGSLAHTTPQHSPAHTTPQHSPAHTTPPHSPAHTTPQHSPVHTTPQHSPAHTTPPHSPAHTTPPHSPAYTTPPHSPAYTTPPHSPAYTTPPHSPSSSTPPNSPSHTTPPHSPAQATPGQSWLSTESLAGVAMVTTVSNGVPASPLSIGCSTQFSQKPFAFPTQGRAKPSVPERKSSLRSSSLPVLPPPSNPHPPPPPSPSPPSCSSNPPPPPLPTHLPPLPTPPPLPHTSSCPRLSSQTSSTPPLPPPAPCTPEKCLPNYVSPPPFTSAPRGAPAPPSPPPLKEICGAGKGQSPSPPGIAPVLQVLQLKPVCWAPAVAPPATTLHPILKPVAEGGVQTPEESSQQWGSVELQDRGESPVQWGHVEVDSGSGGSTPLGCSRESLVSEFSTGSLEELQFPALAIQEQEFPSYPIGHGPAGDTDSDSSPGAAADTDSDSTTGSLSPKETRNADVFEEMLEELLTPNPPRTTEDLFVAIHRSKRKVLGRRQSEAERVFGPSPTGMSLRSLRRCASSCEGFKALLLRKGIRGPGSTSRMSAAEMLRCSAPCFQRSQSQAGSAPPPAPRAARSQARGTHGWPPTPPPAVSGRYSSRGRLLPRRSLQLSLIPECTALEETQPLWEHTPYEATPSLQTGPFSCLLPLAPPPWGRAQNWGITLPPSPETSGLGQGLWIL